MKVVKKWFNPKKHTGWSKDQAQDARRRTLLGASSRSLTPHNRYLQAARRAQALGNVSTDVETKRKAVSDARYFYAKADKTKPKETKR